MSDLADTVARLEARVQRLEDERAIIDVLTSYGFAVDADAAELTGSKYTAEAVIDIDGQIFFEGREAIEDMVRGDAHQSILPDCAHVMGPFVVDVDGDEAVATGYASVFIVRHGERRIWRQAVNRWTLQRTPHGWQVSNRASRALGSEGAVEFLRHGAAPR